MYVWFVIILCSTVLIVDRILSIQRKKKGLSAKELYLQAAELNEKISILYEELKEGRNDDIDLKETRKRLDEMDSKKRTKLVKKSA